MIEFLSSTVARAEDGSLLIVLFNRQTVLLRCSDEAALSLLSNIAARLANGKDVIGGDDA